MARKALLVAGAITGAVVGLVVARDASAKYEEPAYTVLARDGNIEIRQYPKVTAAEVTVEGSGSPAANTAFRILAGYIFGKNRSNKKLAMTVPVTQQTVSQKIAMTVPVTTQLLRGSTRMSFFMPSQYSLPTLPEPLDDRIKFVEVPPSTYAVIRFSGFAQESSISRHEAELMSYLGQHKMEAIGEPLRAFYNPPWTLPFLRRNELWIAIRN